MFLGTAADNSADARAKGRMRCARKRWCDIVVTDDGWVECRMCIWFNERNKARKASHMSAATQHAAEGHGARAALVSASAAEIVESSTSVMPAESLGAGLSVSNADLGGRLAKGENHNR